MFLEVKPNSNPALGSKMKPSGCLLVLDGLIYIYISIYIYKSFQFIGHIFKKRSQYQNYVPTKVPKTTMFLGEPDDQRIFPQAIRLSASCAPCPFAPGL